MLYCSHCKYEYENEVSVCPDCGEKLEEAPVRIEETHNDIDNNVSDEWVPLIRLVSEHESEMVVEALRRSGIKTVLFTSDRYFRYFIEFALLGYNPIICGYVVLVEMSSVVDADRIGQAILGELWEKSKLFDVSE